MPTRMHTELDLEFQEYYMILEHAVISLLYSRQSITDGKVA